MFRVLGKVQDKVTKAMYGKEVPVQTKSFYDLMDRDMDGREVRMSDFKGYVLCVVNVASKWGATKLNYTGLTKLADEYGSRGLKILAFPCNQFNKQEPGTHAEILDFVEKKFGAKKKLTFFEKADVNGKNTRPVFSFLKQKLPNKDGSTDVRWNFSKFIIDHEGNPYERYSLGNDPYEKMKDSIEELLRRKEVASKL